MARPTFVFFFCCWLSRFFSHLAFIAVGQDPHSFRPQIEMHTVELLASSCCMPHRFGKREEWWVESWEGAACNRCNGNGYCYAYAWANVPHILAT